MTNDVLLEEKIMELFTELITELNKEMFNPWIRDTDAQVTFDAMSSQGPTIAHLRDVLGGRNTSNPEDPSHIVTLWNFTDPDNWVTPLVTLGLENFIGLQTANFTQYSDIGINNLISDYTENSGGWVGFLENKRLVVMNGTDR